MRFKKVYFVWLLSLLVIGQSVWLHFRINKLDKLTPEYLSSQQQRQAETNLQSLPEPEIKQILSIGGKLWIDSSQINVGQDISLNIWANFEQSINKVDLRIFYPPELLELTDSAWQADKEVGLASWSSSDIQGETLKDQIITTITFKAKNPGIAFLEFDFNKGSMLDTNLIDIKGNDILEQAKTGEVLIAD